MYCEKCGGIIPENATNCPKCNAAVEDAPINADAMGKTAKKRIKQSPIAESPFAIFRMKAGNIKVRIKVAVKNRIIFPARDAGEPNFKFLNRVFFIPFSTNFKFTK